MDRKYKVDIDSDKENDEENNNEDDDKFDPIPIENTSSKLLFVYQSPDAKRLHRRYGGNLILLDATYKRRKYSLPLFFVDIQTKVNYQVAPVFVTQKETFEMLSQVLQIIKGIFLFIILYFKYTLNQGKCLY